MSQIGRNIWFASLSTLIPSLLTYLFWFLVGTMVGPPAIGIASAIASITIIFTTLDVLDTSLGMKRSLGIAHASGDLKRFKQILTSAISFVSILVCINITLLAIPQLHILERLGIDPIYTWIIIAMIPGLSFQYILTEAMISALMSKHLVLPLFVGALLRFPLFIGILYSLNEANQATVIAYSSLVFVPTIFYAVFLRNYLKVKVPFNPSKIISDIKKIIAPSLASWFPHLLSVLGSQLGIVTVFSLSGSSEGGLFYIPMAIFSVVLFLISGMNRVSHPLVAGIGSTGEQVNLLTHLMKFAFIFTMPIVASVLYFSADFLGLLGSEFRQGAPILSVLMFAVPIGIISEMVYYFVYGRGDNKSVLYLGLIANCPRILLYLILTPQFGGLGAAFAYIAGSISQFLLTVRIGRAHSLNLRYKECFIVSSIPLILGFLTWSLGLNYLLSLIIIVLISIALYIKLHILEEPDLTNVINICLPARIAKNIHPIITLIVRKIS